MKRIITLMLLLGTLVLSVNALSPTAETTLYEHLVDVNKQWLKIDPGPDLLQPIAFEDDTKRIQTHLLNVIQYLNSKDLSQFTEAEQAKRKHLLDVLHQYALSSVFPKNYDFDFRIPYFIDAHNTACAVGYLIIADGHNDLAQMIRAEGNNDYLLDMTYPELGEWVASSGFTAGELALIQPGYGEYGTPYKPFAGGTGTNGVVHTVLVDQTNDYVYIGGEFTEVNGQTGFSNVAFFDGSQWNNMQGGLDDVVRDIAVFDNAIYVAGEFSNVSVSTAAEGIIKWSNGGWHLINTMAMYGDVYCMQEFNGKLYFGGNFEFATGAIRGYLSAISTGSTTVEYLQEMPFGTVYDMTVHNGDLVFVGDFSSTIFSQAALDGIGAMNSAGTMGSSGDGNLSAQLRSVASHDGKLYVGGRFYDNQLDSLTAIAYWDNTNWTDMSHRLRPTTSIDTNVSINSLQIANGELYAAGDFTCCWGLISPGPTGGPSLVTITEWGMYGSLSIDGIVNDVAWYDSTLMIAGDFSTISWWDGWNGTSPALSSENLGGLALKGIPDSGAVVGIDDPENLPELNLYPNPVVEYFMLDMDEYAGMNNISITVTDMAGREVFTMLPFQGLSQVRVNTSGLPAGNYFYKLSNSEQLLSIGKFIKQ